MGRLGRKHHLGRILAEIWFQQPTELRNLRRKTKGNQLQNERKNTTNSSPSGSHFNILLDMMDKDDGYATYFIEDPAKNGIRGRARVLEGPEKVTKDYVSLMRKEHRGDQPFIDVSSLDLADGTILLGT